MSQRWRVLTGAFLLRRLDDDLLVYCHASGGTHRFEGAEAWVFDQLLERPVSPDELAEAARDLTEAPPGFTMAQALRQILEMFEHLGLAAREA